MITFVSESGQVALQVAAQDNNMVFGVFSSWEDFRNGSSAVTTQNFTGINNYAAVESFFAGWTKVCRNDADWEIVLCGENPTPVVPENVSARQIRLWLVSNGISLTQIAALIDGIEDPQQREVAKIEWEFAPYIERTHPLVATFAAALGLTAEQIDAGFIVASTL